MKTLGQQFTNRYRTNTSIHYVEGMAGNALDNTMLYLSTEDGQSSVASTLAFMQGLFPPNNNSFAYNDGGEEAADIVSDGGTGSGNIVRAQFPLGGYQYPDVRSPAPQDESFLFVRGDAQCPSHFVRADRKADLSVYDAAIRTIFERLFPGVFYEQELNSEDGIKLWDYARYEANHNATISSLLGDGELKVLEEVASVRAWEKTADLEVGDMIMAVAGRTLLGNVGKKFTDWYSSGGFSNRMNIVVGSWEPILAFAALANLTYGEYLNKPFSSIPEFGTTLVFELYARGQLEEEKTQPDLDDLRVKIYWAEYSNDTFWEELDIFGVAKEGVLLSEFRSFVTERGINNAEEWCRLCGGVTAASFCPGYLDDFDSNSNIFLGPLTPAIAGVIGSIGMLLLVLVVGIVAKVCGGLRIHRDNKNNEIKGDGKSIIEDQDIFVDRKGKRRAKIGSWELRQKRARERETAVKEAEAAVEEESRYSSSRRVRLEPKHWAQRREGEIEIQEDEISILGPQVHPKESV